MGREGAGRKGAAVSRAGWGLDVGQPAAASAAAASPSGALALHRDGKRGQGRAPGAGGRAPLTRVCLARVMPACGALTASCHLIHQIYFVSPQTLPRQLLGVSFLY